MRKKLGEILVEQGSVQPADVDAALDQQSGGDPARIGDLLLAAGKVSPLQLAKALCVQSGLPFVQLDQVSPQVAALVPIALQREHCLVPFKEDGRGKSIHVAVADPTTTDVLAELEFQVGRELKVSIAARDEIEAVHAALQGDVLEAAIVEDDAPAPPPAANSPQALGRLALKRVAVSADGQMVELPRPSTAAAPPPSPPPEVSKPSRFPLSNGPPTAAPTIEMPLVPLAEPAAPAKALPQRAARPAKSNPGPPPVLKPIEPPTPTAPARPKSKSSGAVTKKPMPSPSSPGGADDWSVRPVASAIPRGAPRPAESPTPPVLDPFATLPTEQIGGPREYVPSGPLAPLSALDADPAVHDALNGPEVSFAMGIPSPTMVEFYVAPPAPLPVSKLAIEPAPLALSPPRRKPSSKGVVPDASLGVVPDGPHLQFSRVPPAPASVEITAEVPALVVVRPPPQPVPSGREKPLETQLQASPEPMATELLPAHVPVASMRTESLEFIPPAETAPRPGRPSLAAQAQRPERAATPPEGNAAVTRPPLEEGDSATPPGGEPIITEQIERPAEEAPAATPPKGSRAAAKSENLVSGAVVAPATLTPPVDDALRPLAAASDAVLTEAPLELSPMPSAPPPGAAPAQIELAVSPEPLDLDLPEWMREAGSAKKVTIADPLAVAVAAGGSTTALVRVLRLMIQKGLLTEAELIEELKKG